MFLACKGIDFMAKLAYPIDSDLNGSNFLL